MDERENASEQPLHIYIAYEDFLNVEQLAEVFATLDRLYTVLFRSLSENAPEPLPLEARMRISQCRTGDSITIQVIEGILQAWNMAEPAVIIPGAVGATWAMGKMICGFAKGFAEIRKTWYEGTKTKEEARKIRSESRTSREAEERAFEAEKPDRESKRRRPTESEGCDTHGLSRVLESLPPETKKAASDATIQLLSIFEYAPNIVLVEINNTIVIDKRSDVEMPS